MTRIFEGQEFRDFRDRGGRLFRDRGGRTFSDLVFRDCAFVNCSVSLTDKVHRRSTIRNVTVLNATAINCDVNCAVIEDTLVENVRADGSSVLTVWGAALKHVTLRGVINTLKITSLIDPWATPERQRAFDEANRRYYEEVDWALDIREAEFEDIEVSGVPGRLIRRDPETSALVTRQKAEEGRWRTLELSKTYWPTSLEFYLRESPWDTLVLVAPKRVQQSRFWTYQTLLDGLRLLRAEGIAEPE